MSGGWSGGVFSISADMSANELAGIPILSRPFSDQRDDIISGINNCLTKDGQNSPSADLPMGSRKHTGVAPAVAVTNYLRANEYILDRPRYMVDQNPSTATASISCSALYWVTSAEAGMTARIKVNGTKPNADAAEVEVVINGLTVSATGPDGNPLDPGALVSGGIYDFVYDGSKFRVMNPSVSVKTFAAVFKGFTAAVAPATISTGATLTLNAGVNGDMAFITVGKTAAHQLSMANAGATFILWDGLPSYLDSSAGGATKVVLKGSAGTDLGLAAYIDQGELVISNVFDPAGANAFGSTATLEPFSLTYPRRRSVP